MFELVIDNRESAIIAIAQSAGIKHSVELLEVGDIIITQVDVNGIRQDFYIIERKTIPDLVASVKDGRYQEQKTRLKASIEQKKAIRFFYIIEGSLNLTSPADGAIAQGAMISMALRDSIPIVRVGDVAETVNWIQRIQARLNKNSAEFIGEPPEQPVNASYLSSVKSKKNANITPHICQCLALAGIPSISTKMAEAILVVHGTIRGLLNAYKALDDSGEAEEKTLKLKESLLAEIQVGSRKLGSVASKRVYEFLAI